MGKLDLGVSELPETHGGVQKKVMKKDEYEIEGERPREPGTSKTNSGERAWGHRVRVVEIAGERVVAPRIEVPIARFGITDGLEEPLPHQTGDGLRRCHE
jgi:hypothetical protein